MDIPKSTILQKQGLRATRPRLNILAVLSQAQDPMSAQAVYAALLGNGADRSSVFRTLKLLGGLGILSVTESPRHEQLYELAPKKHHHHLHCERCGRVVTIPCYVAPGVFRTIQKQAKFPTIRHATDLSGICANCTAQLIR